MKTQNLKIAIVIFLTLLGGIIYLAFGIPQKQEYQISVIEIEGNLHLPKNSYYEYANLDDKVKYNELTLAIIRDRLQKHPYIQKVDVKYEGNGKVSVNLFEKEFKATLLANGKQYLITKNLEILPLLKFSQKIDYPVIRNIKNQEVIKAFTRAYNNESIIKSFKILTAAKLLNPGLYDNLSDIDLMNGKNTVIYFSSVDYQVVIGQEKEVMKMLVLEKLWESIGTVRANAILQYVDLRFDNKVYLGVAGDKMESKEVES